MQSILLIMWRDAVAQGLLMELKKEPDTYPYYETDYMQADTIIRNYNAKAVLLEATEKGAYDTLYCLAVCTRLKKEMSNCRLLLMCPERDDEAINQAIKAKQNGYIDDFVFYEESLSYIASMLLL